MKIPSIILAGIIALALLCMVTTATAGTAETGVQDSPDSIEFEDLPLIDDPIGADNPLYGLKLAWEDLDESFTANESERVTKQMKHAQLRLSEVKVELAKNRTRTAEQALDLYWQKINLTQMRLAYFGSNATGLLHAQEMHAKHQIVLENLMISHPGNPGLERAYNNSLGLEQKFEEKTQTRFDKGVGKNNNTIIRAYRIGARTENPAGNGEGEQNANQVQAQNEERGKNRDTVTGTQKPDNTTDTRGRSGQDTPGPSNPASPQPGKSTDNAMQGSGNANGNSDDKGNGNSRRN
ncbi:MAG TPA: hypothetical protein HA272_08040 [Methanoregula sp.]|nr:hypothetical protein [Methanoregula sp.]